MRRTRKIVFVNRVLPPQKGATGRLMLDLAMAFAKDGWSVSLLATGRNDLKTRLPKKLSQKLKIYRVGRVFKKTVFGYFFAYISLFFALLRLKKHDVIVTLSDPPLIVLMGRIVAAIKGSYHVHWSHDLYPDLFPYVGVNLPGFVQKILKNLSRKALKKADKVIVPGRCMARRLTHTGVEPSKIAVIPNWYDKSLTMKATTAKKESKAPSKPIKPLFMDERPKFRVLYAGSMGKIHVSRTLIEAAMKIREKYDDIEFVFVGDGAGHERLAKMRAERDISNIRFLPYQPHERLQDLMQSGDIHIVTLKEGLQGLSVPSKFYSSLGVGRPCLFLGPEESEIAKVIKDFKCGEVISPENVNALVLAISSFRDDESVWFNAQKGALKAASQMKPEQSFQAWIERVNDVVEQV